MPVLVPFGECMLMVRGFDWVLGDGIEPLDDVLILLGVGLEILGAIDVEDLWHRQIFEGDVDKLFKVLLVSKLLKVDLNVLEENERLRGSFDSL